MKSLLLAVDIGNTTIMMGVFSEEKLMSFWRFRSNSENSADEWGMFTINQIIHNKILVSDISGIIISSVVPSINPVFNEMCQKYFNINPVFVSSGMKLGITIQYDDPRQVGADRLCVVVAGMKKFGTPLVIVDFGTATTFDIILSGGIYPGGVIAPGIETATAYLRQRAAKLPLVELRFPDKVIGRNTEESIQSGILCGAVAQVDGLIGMIYEELGEKTPVVATGGLASIIQEHAQSITHVEPFLVLYGLLEIYNK
jgi:type III pantothenate kinase